MSCFQHCSFHSIKAKVRGEEPPTELPPSLESSFESESAQDRLSAKFGEDGLASQVVMHCL